MACTRCKGETSQVAFQGLKRFRWVFLALAWLAVLGQPAGAGQDAAGLDERAAKFLEQGDFDRARQDYLELLETGRRSELRETILTALYGLSEIAIAQMDGKAAQRYCTERLALATEGDNHLQIASARMCLGESAMWRNDLEAAREQFQKAYYHLAKAEDMRNASLLNYRLSEIEEGLGNMETAVSEIDTAVFLSRNLGETVYLAASLARQAYLAEKRGEFTVAARSLREAYEITAAGNSDLPMPAILTSLIRLAERQGDKKAVVEWRKKLVAEHRRLGNVSGVVRELLQLIGTALERRDAAAVERYLREITGPLRETGPEEGLARTFLETALASDAAGERRSANALLRALLDFHPKGGAAMQAHFWLAQFAEEATDWARQSRHLEAALVQAEAMGEKREILRAHSLLGVLADDRQDWEKAIRHYQRVIAIKEEAGETEGLAGYHNLVAQIGLRLRDEALVVYHAKQERAPLRKSGETAKLEKVAELLAWFSCRSGAIGQCESYLQTALVARGGVPKRALGAMVGLELARLAMGQRSHVLAKQRLNRALTWFRDAGPGGYVAVCLDWLGRIAEMEDDTATAVRHYQGALAAARKAEDNQLIANSATQLGTTLLKLGEATRAEHHLSQARDLYRRFDRKEGEARTVASLAESVARQDDRARLATLARDLVGLRTELGDQVKLAAAHNLLGRLFSETGDLATACRHWQDAVAVNQAIGISAEVDAGRERMASAGYR